MHASLPRLAIFVLAITLAALSLPSISNTTAAAASRSKGTVRVKLAGLPTGLSARVVVKGQGRTIRASAPAVLRRLPVGRYRLIAKNVVSAEHTYFADQRRQAFRVKKNRTTKLRVTFGTAVSNDIAVLAPEDVAAAADGRQITIAAGVPTPHPGQIMAVDAGPQSPQGIFGEVVAADGRTITLGEASMYDAVPMGSFRESFDLTGADLMRGAKGMRASAARSLVRDIAQEVNCSGSASMTVKGSFAIEPSFTLKADWGLRGVTSASLVGNLNQSTTLSASLDAAASCGVESFPLLARPLQLRPVTVMVGGVPLVFVPQIQLYFDASAEAQGHITTSITQRADVRAGVKFVKGEGVSPVSDVSKSLDHEAPGVADSADVKVSISPEFSFLLYGAAGPYVGLHGGLHLHASTQDDPWWNLRSNLSGYGGLRIKPLALDKSIDPVFVRSWLLAQATGRPPVDSDADGDGFAANLDCDDRDSEIYPGANEIPGDGIDQDCDGTDLVLGEGDVQATLSWQHEADMDLHVIDPAGDDVYWSDPSVPSGGELDHDANVGCGGPNAVENIYWPERGAPSGGYWVFVDEYDACGLANTPWHLVVRVRGEVVVDITGSGNSDVIPFDVS